MANQLGDNLYRDAQDIRKQEQEVTTQQLANRLNLGYADLLNYPVAPEVLRLFPAEVVKYTKVAPYLKVGDQLKVATPIPENPQIPPTLTDLAKQLKLSINLNVCSPNSYDHLLELYESLPEEIDIHQRLESQSENEDLFTVSSLSELANRIKAVSTSQLLELIIATAIGVEASDIHIEPEEASTRIRFRIDGVLQDVASLEHKSYKMLNSRLKFLSGLKLSSAHSAQDGRFSFAVGQQKIDIRLSSLPGIYGEVFVLRLLATQAKFLKLEEMGFRPEAINQILQETRKPNGLVLNTGPTGSGKTTTLYAILAGLNQSGVKIVTLEDPIEYRLAGVDQVQVEKSKLSFGDGLRAILRQDPDIIMVGEIRDGETASIALQAAMTGHLVLSTLHTNNAPAALVRLVDMGLEPYMLSGSINLIIAQRLVRKICVTCKGVKVLGGNSCPKCNGIGYKGRVGLVELLKPTRDIEQLVLNKAPMADIIATARAQGMVTLQEDGIMKVQQGITTQEEVLRVTQDYGV